MTADKFLEVALSQVGYKETGNNKTKYGEWYGMNGQPWCAMFISWCAYQVGVLDKLIPKYASSSAGYRWFKKKTYITMQPKAGDIGFIKNIGADKDTYPASHTFIVYEVNGNVITTIEGNIDNRVVKQTRKISDSNILGFGVVEWAYNTMYVDNVDYEGLNVRYISTNKKTGRVLPIATEVNVLRYEGNKAIISKETYVDRNYLSTRKPSYKVVAGADSQGLNVRPRHAFGIMGQPIARLKNGTRVKVYQVKGKWSKVSPNANAWCYSEYLR